MSSATRFRRFTNYLAALSAVFFFLAAATVNAAIYSLGDSLTDSGALGITYTNPVELSPLAEGNVWVQYLTNSVPAFCDDPKHCHPDRDTYYYSRSGNNYAVGGAGVTFDSTDSALAQIGKPSFTSLHYQVKALLHNRKLTTDDIVTVWMGANDILAATADPANSVAFVSNAAKLFSVEIARLGNHGPKIYVLTIPDLAKTPLGANLPLPDSQFLTDLTNVFNNGISGLANLKNVRLIDSNAFFEVAKTSGLFDLSNTYCPNLIDPNNVCGTVANPIEHSAEVPFMFADPVHPSNALHQWIGAIVKKLIR